MAEYSERKIINGKAPYGRSRNQETSGQEYPFSQAYPLH